MTPPPGRGHRPGGGRGGDHKEPPEKEREQARQQERHVEELSRGSLRAFPGVLGPGLVSGSSDDDPSAIASFAQAGSQFGYGLLWTAILTFPLMAAVQEMCARIALQTGTGLGVALRRRFPTWLVGACVLGLVVSNVVTLGADLGAVAAGIALLARGHAAATLLVVPVAAVVLALQVFATFEVIFRIFKWLTLALFAYVAAGLLSHPATLDVLRGTLVPHVESSTGFLLTLAAVFGTAFSPYILFWQGSMEATELERAGTRRWEIRHGVGPRHLRAARVDVLTGMFVAQAVMYFVILTSAATLHAHGVTRISGLDQAARALQPVAGSAAFVLFALGFIGAGMLATPVLSASAAYAVTELTGARGSLELKPRAASAFYAVIAAATAVGTALNFLHLDLIQVLVVASAISGAVSAPLILLVTAVGADRRVMRNRSSGPLSRTLTSVAGAAMGLVALAWLCSPLLRRL